MPAAAARLARLIALAALVVGSAGCARLFGTYDVAPNGLTRADDRLRSMLAGGQAATAFQNFGGTHTAPDDDVLRALYHGVIAYYAGEYAESARTLDRAADLADDRITKSISRSALSVIANDLILPYEPARTERLMIPYYAALARLAMGDTEGASVEARRLSMLLQRISDDERPLDKRIAATLRYVAGAVFEANGDRGDAEIAYRNAAALDSTFAVPSFAARPATGSIVVVLEHGFVAHRVEQGLSVMLAPEEVDLIANGDSEEKAGALGLVAARTLHYAAHGPSFYGAGYRPGALFVPAPEDRASIPRRRARVVCRTVADEGEKSDSTRSTPVRNGASARPAQECREETPEIDELPYLLKVAWPVYARDTRSAGPAWLVGGSDTVAFPAAVDLSQGVIADFEAERALIVARTVARGAAKFALTKGAEKSLEDKSEAAGRLLGVIGNLSGVLLERADIRSWHLLPGSVSIVRLDLPPGEHTLATEVGIEQARRTLMLSPIMVAPGSTHVLATRAW
jgi:hypothetical protein